MYIKNQKQTDELPKSQVGYGLGEVWPEFALSAPFSDITCLIYKSLSHPDIAPKYQYIIITLSVYADKSLQKCSDLSLTASFSFITFILNRQSKVCPVSNIFLTPLSYYHTHILYCDHCHRHLITRKCNVSVIWRSVFLYIKGPLLSVCLFWAPITIVYISAICHHILFF